MLWSCIFLEFHFIFSDPSNVFCLKPCEFINPDTGDTKFVKIGDNVTLPDQSARGQSWVNENGTVITVINCLIQKSYDPDIPISGFQDYELSDINECASGVTNPKTGVQYCNFAESECVNLDLIDHGRQYLCSCKSNFTVYDNSACTDYCKYIASKKTNFLIVMLV